MKKIPSVIISMMLSAVVFSAVPSARAQNVSAGVSLQDGKIKDFYLAISGYFHVPEPRVMEMKQRYNFNDEEMPVVLFLAARAGVEPSVIIDLRRKRMSWWNIGRRFNINPEVFFVTVNNENIGRPYGNAYGYYRKNRGMRDWGKTVLSDPDMVNLVNLKFMSEHHGIPAERIMKMRRGGANFPDIRRQGLREMDKKGNKGLDKGKPGKGQHEKGKGKGPNR